MKKLIKYLFTLALAILPLTTFSSSYDGIFTPIVKFKAGDLIIIPTTKFPNWDTYLMVLWGEDRPVFFDAYREWFQYEPIRNWQTAFIDVTRQIPAKVYQFIEIHVTKGGDPTNLADWRDIREYKAQIIDCNYYINYSDATCLRGVNR